MRIIVAFSRWTLGLLFIFSGFVKAVDPIGGAIKFADYFNAFHLSFLSPIAVHLAIILASLEFLIGIYLIFNVRRNTTAWLTLLFMSFFTLLTLYSAVFSPVSDCGCFGDALKLSNWETFFKNLIFLPLAVIFFSFRKGNEVAISEWRKWSVTLYFSLLILVVNIYGLAHLPLIDFRPFKVGNNITEGMSVPDDAPKPVYETTFIYEKDGQQEEFTLDNYPANDTTWHFVNSKTKVIDEGYQPPIHDFALYTSGGVNETESILNNDKPLFLLVAHKVEKADWRSLRKMMQIAAQAQDMGYPFYLVTSSPDEVVEDLYMKTGANFDVLKCDDTALKTMIRANAGLVLLQKGTVVGKWNANFTPSVEEFKNPIGAGLHFQTSNRISAYLLVILFLSTTFAVAILKTK